MNKFVFCIQLFSILIIVTNVRSHLVIRGIAGSPQDQSRAQVSDYRGRNIKDITQMMTVLSKFKNLSEISLHGNKLTSIPPMDTLRNLKILDLSNNPIKVSLLLSRLITSSLTGYTRSVNWRNSTSHAIVKIK